VGGLHRFRQIFGVVTERRRKTKRKNHPSQRAAKIRAPSELGRLFFASADARLREQDPRAQERHLGYAKREETVTSKNLQDAKPVVGVRGRPRGVRLSLHERCVRAASRRQPRALSILPGSGDHKGYCPCMRFISAEGMAGK